MTAGTTISINRAPVLTLWAAIVAERLGHDHDAALTLGKAVAGLNAQSKGRRLGIMEPASPATAAARAKARERAGTSAVVLLGRHVPVLETRAGLRAVTGTTPDDPASVERYLTSKFGEHLDAVRAALTVLARAVPKRDLESRAFALYEAFRPSVPEGTRGWGAKGVLDLTLVRKLATREKA
jgi:hypothetical protein